MNMFDGYRDERHYALIQYRENEHLQYKGMGDNTRINKEDPLSEHFSRMANSLSELKSSLRSEKKENTVLKQAEKFYGESK